MSILQHGAAHSVFADQGAQARQRDIQAARFRKLGREEAELYLAGITRLGKQSESQYGGLGRMSFQIQVQQLDPERFLIAGQCGPDGADVRSSDLQRQCEGD